MRISLTLSSSAPVATPSPPALKQPLRGTFSVPSQELQGLAVELVTAEVLELAVGARRIEYPECAVEIPERTASPSFFNCDSTGFIQSPSSTKKR